MQKLLYITTRPHANPTASETDGVCSALTGEYATERLVLMPVAESCSTDSSSFGGLYLRTMALRATRNWRGQYRVHGGASDTFRKTLLEGDYDVIFFDGEDLLDLASGSARLLLTAKVILRSDRFRLRTNRRQFLRGLGLTGLASATLPGFMSRRARAASSDSPKRLIIVSTGHGTVHEHWQMHPGGEPEDATWETSLSGLAASEWSRSLAPLQPYADRINVFDGLAMCSAERDIPGYRHEKGWIHAWTGAPAYFTGSDLFGTAPSLDQLVAAELAREDRLPSLELDVWGGRPVCHAGLAQQLPLEADPRRAFDRIFGLSTTNDPLIAAQGSVLDFASAEHQAIRGRLSSADRARLDTHFDLVRQLETRIAGLSEASCPTAPDRGVLTSEEAEYDALFRSMVDVVAAAFSSWRFASPSAPSPSALGLVLSAAGPASSSAAAPSAPAPPSAASTSGSPRRKLR